MSRILRIVMVVFVCMVSCSKDKRIKYYPDESIKSIVEMNDGKRDGKLIEYYKNGNVKSEGEWRDGMQHGKVIHYYSSGKINTTSQWTNGNEDGISKKYTEDGLLYSVGRYENNVKREIVLYQNGKLPLERQLFNDQGRLIYVARYDSLGKKEYSMLPPIFKSSSDTINLGETYKVTISFGVPVDGKLKAYTGTLNSKLEMTDTADIIERSGDGKLRYSIKPAQPGTIIIPFYFSHIPEINDSIDINGMLTKHVLYVNDTTDFVRDSIHDLP